MLGARQTCFIAMAAAALSLFTPLGSHTAQAGSVQSPASIEAAAEAHLRRLLANEGLSFEVVIGPVDRRLRLARCTDALTAFVPPGGRRKGQVTVGVRCPGQTRWKLFVSANVRIYDEVVVARQTLVRGHVIAPSDLIRQRRDISRLSSGFFTEPAALIGKHTKRSIAAGEVIRHRVLTQPKSVRRGQRVVLVARSLGFEVRMEGQALAPGDVGDVIRVRNRRSRRIVEGIVANNGVVHVQM